MKRNILFYLILFNVFLIKVSAISAQKVMTIHHSCSFDGTETEAEYYVDESSKEATQIVEKIMRVNVLPQNFIIKSANCKNALATTEGGDRYILFSTNFLENFKKEANTQWAAYSVLAHEIGHHLSNHNLAETNNQKRKLYELQADKFAGGILFRLGATLEQAQAGIKTFSLESETTTHPSKTARLESVAQGWVQAKETQQDKPIDTPIVKQNKSDEKTKFTEVSDNLAAEKIIGKWQSNSAFKDTYEFFKDNFANLSQYFAVSSTLQTTKFKWLIKDGKLVRMKVFPNGSLGSPEIFIIKMSDDGSTLQLFTRWGDVSIWKKIP